MHRPSTRLPVHLLVDIDHTLVHPICSHVEGDSPDTRRHSSTPLPSSSAGGWWPLNYVGGRVTHVHLRPHVVPFLSHVLLDRLLDTSEAQVHVSLYTRQSAAYCTAIAHQVLLPALAQCKGTSLQALRRKGVFHGLFGGEHCVRGKFEAMQWWSPSPGCLSEGNSAAQRQRREATVSREWCKTIFLSPTPLTTLLIDDRCENFRVAELRTGHGVLIPSYHTDAVACAADDCFRVPPTDSLYDIINMDFDGGAGNMSSRRAMLGRVDVNDVVVRLLDVLEAFVQCCHSHRRVIEAMHSASSGIPGADERTPCPLVDASLGNFNFFDRSPLYRRQWNAFHADYEDLLHSYFTG
ncbi:hypothetical protein LtaPh_1512600 [Leishmania tarentolae]|uniref:FCP1 homology domain-containing protein n=1 Tax=Leishmania tarentolae TaxID=5689 RepID=A0A640KDQ2_LEITA|nr:hypothetical protein LtaPh_1512600 [Leishmania tarentolae]